MLDHLGDARPLGWSEPGRYTLETKTGGWRTRRPVYIEATAPCRTACPAREPIARWIERARAGDYRSAWDLIRQENPFPAIMGRVCAHRCESVCNRGQWDGAVAIQALERFVGDWGLAHGMFTTPPPIHTERIAVIGGGPAGLACAYHLTRLGHPVHLYEAQEELGGLLRYGIPDYRLPREVLEREIALAIGPGVEVFTHRRLGDNLAWAALADYDAVFLATGAARPLDLRVPGATARGIGHGVSFLHAVNTGRAPSLGTRLVVVGGGSTAMDVARSARRLGVESVTVLALEAREDMPALPEEVTDALAEGIEIVNGVGVSAFVERRGDVAGVKTLAASVERGLHGEIRPRFLPGVSTIVEADCVVLAIGQAPDLSALPATLGSERGLVLVDAEGGTVSGHVFAGGDLASSRRTVTEAIAAGTRAARRIHAKLTTRGTTPWAQAPPWVTWTPDRVVPFGDINLARFRSIRRTNRGGQTVTQRLRSFGETLGGMAEPVARAEMARCFTCGHCTCCDTCFLVCPDMAIAHRSGGYGYQVSTEHCKGCGLCVAECPRGALQMVSER